MSNALFVMDCSVTMAWCFEDESSSYADEVLSRLEKGEALVPSLWPLEVGNVLLVGERRHRLKQADTTRFLALLRNLPIRVDAETPSRAFSDILSLGRDHALSSYDASYLELAMRHGVPLATLDDGLRKVALKLGMTLV